MSEGLVKEQRIVVVTQWIGQPSYTRDEEGKFVPMLNLDVINEGQQEMNRLLQEGWAVANASPMGAAGDGGSADIVVFGALIVLEREKSA